MEQSGGPNLVAGGVVGWKTCTDAMVDGIAEDVATSTLAKKLGAR